MSSVFSFRLSESFLSEYKDKQPSWGFTDAGGNSVGELIFIRTYSRLKDDNTKERWWEVCQRVIEGMYTIQKDWCIDNRLDWNGHKAQASAQEAYDLMFNLKWTPPGRGLSQMGTPLVMDHRNAASLLNCGAVSTGDMDRHDPGYHFAWTTEALMLGIGIGFDTLGATRGFTVNKPLDEVDKYTIPDDRQGWAKAIGKLVNSYLKKDQPRQEFIYSEIRPYGSPIKTFGGTASGPEPLEAGIEQIRGVLEANVGSELSSKTITDIENIIGSFVVAGNSRRSAELAIGSADDDVFPDLKNEEKYPDRHWRWMSNNSISSTVGMDYSRFIKNTVQNGEPGYVWLDVARKYGRLADAPDYKDKNVIGFNPCVTADTWVLTSEGPQRVASLIGKKFTAIVDGKPHDTLSNGFWLTGTDREVYDIVTDSGWTTRVTANHKIMTTRGWVEASELNSEDEIVIHDHKDNNWSGRGENWQGYLLGQLWGDGTFAGENRAVLSVWGTSEATKHIRSVIESYVRKMPVRSDFSGFSHIPDRQEWRLRTSGLTSLANSFGMVKGHKKITDDIETASSDFYIGFLRGVFDTDGHVEGSQEKGVTIRLSQSDEIELIKIQRMLGRIGIASKIRLMHRETEWSIRPSYRLIISGADAQVFMNRIGFEDEAKTSKWESLTAGMKRGFYFKPRVTKFLSLELAGVEDVYDVTVADVHAFDANGLYVHNCVEQPLESFEMCCLVTIHLNNIESKEEFRRAIKFAYLYGKTVTLMTTPWPKTNAVMLRNRRIGLSTTGVAGFVENNSLFTYREWSNDGFEYVSDLDKQYSEWLGIRESIRKTTLKPEGSVSLLSGATPGVHYSPGGEHFLRAVRFGASDPAVDHFRAAGYTVEADLASSNTFVVYFPVHQRVKRSERDVTIFEKIHLAAEAQKYWSDNGVSVTVSFNPETEAEHVETVLSMYEGQLKAVSFLPMSNKTYAQQPYQNISEEEYNSYIGKLSKIDTSVLYGEAKDAVEEKYCTTDTCSI